MSDDAISDDISMYELIEELKAENVRLTKELKKSQKLVEILYSQRDFWRTVAAQDFT